jgi:hypothetical protein
MKLPRVVRRSTSFRGVPHTGAEHFRLATLGVVQHVIEHCAEGGVPAALDAYPFLGDYRAEVAELVDDEATTAVRWRGELQAWERRATGNLPLRSLEAAGL